jgi:hypothetical protein
MTGRVLLSFSGGAAVTFTLSFVVWLLLITLSIYCSYEQHVRSRLAQRDIISVLTVGVVFRMFWFAFVLDYNEAWSMIVLNRAAICMQCTGVLFLLLLWVKGMISDEQTYKLVKKLVMCIVVLIWLILISTMIVYRYVCTDGGDCVWYAINLLFVGFVSFFVALSALCYGLYVRYKMLQSTDEEYILSAVYVSRKRITQQLLGVCAVLSCCFTARAFCFTLTFFHEFKGANIYPWLFYQVKHVY